jgi:hypothetical protein
MSNRIVLFFFRLEFSFALHREQVYYKRTNGFGLEAAETPPLTYLVLFAFAQSDKSIREIVRSCLVDNSDLLIKTLGVHEPQLGKDRLSRDTVVHSDRQVEFPALLTGRERHSPKYLLIELAKHDNRTAEGVALAVLLVSNVYTQIEILLHNFCNCILFVRQDVGAIQPVKVRPE